MKILLFFFLSFLFFSCQKTLEEPEISFEIPKNFPKPIYNFSANPVNRAGFELGKALFYEGALSRDGSVSCGSCHVQTVAFTHHGHDLSHGIDDLIGSRNAPAIQNVAWQTEFFWDGGVHDLDLFSIAPITNPVEMDETMDNVLKKLQKNPKYPPMFEKAFGSSKITGAAFLKALSQFMLMLVSANSRYDQYIRKEGATLSNLELEGMAIFEKKCASCHVGTLFTDHQFRNNGLSRTKNNDEGRGRITLNPEDVGKFKVPSLRNVDITAPYMHDGRLKTLEEVLNHYEKGIEPSETLDPILKNGIPLSADEKQKIIAFLKTLTDESFLKDQRFSQY